MLSEYSDWIRSWKYILTIYYKFKTFLLSKSQFFNDCLFYFQIEIPSSGKSRRFRSRDVRRSLFLGKRLAEDQEVEDYSPATKKSRETIDQLSACSIKVRYFSY